MSTMSADLVAISKWVDESEENVFRNREALTWHRVAKVAEEAGAAVEHLRGHAGDSVEMLLEKANRVAVRAGVAEAEL